jgi:hypothetical protein
MAIGWRRSSSPRAPRAPPPLRGEPGFRLPNGSVPSIFRGHPPTAERILDSEQAIQEILPKRPGYI